MPPQFPVYSLGILLDAKIILRKMGRKHNYNFFSSQCVRTAANTGRVHPRASVATISAWAGARSRVTPAAVWPAGTSSMETLVWISALPGTTSSEDGAALASLSARTCITSVNK